MTTKKHNKRIESIKKSQENKKDSKKARKWKYTPICSKRHLKKHQTGKRQAMMEYMASGSSSSPPFTTD